MTVTFPDRLTLAELPTPLQPLDRLSEELDGPRIWMKRDDLTGSALSGNKVRKLEFSVAEALKQDCDTLITCGGIQSNHCRATSIVGARLGLKVHLVLRGEPDGVPEGNLFLDKLFGAEVSFYPHEEYSQNLEGIFDDLVEKYARQDRQAFKIPTGASDEIGAWGYVYAAKELKADCERLGIVPDHVLSATGSGGTLAGLAAGNVLFDFGSKIWGVNVCDTASEFIGKVRHDLAKWKVRYGQKLDVAKVPFDVIDGYAGPGYAQATPDIFETIKYVAHTEGIALDPVYTGKAFYGLMQEIRSGRFRRGENVIFIHTGGIYGNFAYREKFGF